MGISNSSNGSKLKKEDVPRIFGDFQNALEETDSKEKALEVIMHETGIGWVSKGVGGCFPSMDEIDGEWRVFECEQYTMWKMKENL